MARILLFPVILFLSVSSMLAWSAAGHKIVASIAFRQLSQEEQLRVIELLKGHPRFAEDFEDLIPASVVNDGESAIHEWHFQQASIWPDRARGFSGALRSQFHRSSWHFINVPHFLSGADLLAMEGQLGVNLSLDPLETLDGSFNIVQIIRYARTALRQENADDEEKGLMLAWLFHNIGDLHQPLHSTALFSQVLFAGGDRGGNLVTTRQAGNLHSLWDRFPGGSIQFRTARNRALLLLNDEELAAIGEEAALELNEEDWLNGSHLLAITVVYDAEVAAHLRTHELAADDLERLDLSDGYLSAGGGISNRQLIKAGFRLGAVLREIVAE